MKMENRDNSGRAETPDGSVLPAATGRRQNRTVTSDIRKCFIVVLHRETDPCTWIVRCWEKIFWFKRRISSDWFINRYQAFAFAGELKQNYIRHHGMHDA
jgi:hypothetical protein